MPRITGADRVMRKLQRLSAETITREVSPALFAAGEMIKAEAQHSITAGSVSGKHHQPSAPGQPPMNDTGILAAHIETLQRGPLHVEVSSSGGSLDTSAVDKQTGRKFGPGRTRGSGKPVSYAVLLEFGSSKMQARPYMAPAARKMKKEAVKLVRAAVSRAIRKG